LVERFGDPMEIWRQWADDVQGSALAAGHFLMEESPDQLTALLVPFLSKYARRAQGPPTLTEERR
jgi:haloacetate dehalogenase